MPLEYDDYSNDVSAEKLSQELDAMNGGVEKHLIAIAKELMDWEEVAPHLGLPHRFVRDIKEMHRNDPASRRCDSHI